LFFIGNNAKGFIKIFRKGGGPSLMYAAEAISAFEEATL
jgi:hypothetical protein